MMRNRGFTRAVSGIAIGAWLLWGGMVDTLHAEPSDTWNFRPQESVQTEGIPPGQLPTELILDDGSTEGDFGISLGVTARQFLWFNVFPVATNRPIVLEEIQVFFNPGPNMELGNEIQLVVYHDLDGDPTSGASLLATYDETIQVLDGVTFSSYLLDPPLTVPGTGNVLIGVVNRFVESGVTTPTEPAALDTDAPQGQSWVAVWNDDPPAAPDLPPDSLLEPVDSFVAGNWMIRAFGRPQNVIDVPTLAPSAMGLLVVFLATLGVGRLVRRRN